MKAAHPNYVHSRVTRATHAKRYGSSSTSKDSTGHAGGKGSKKGGVCEFAPTPAKRRDNLSTASKVKKAGKNVRSAKKVRGGTGEVELKLPKGARPPKMRFNKELNSEGLEYFVETILDSRKTKKGGREYLVKWAGWSFRHNSWEPEANVENCGNLTKEYHENNPNAV